MAAVERARAAAQAQLAAARELQAAYLQQAFESDEAHQWPKRRIESVTATGSGSTPSRTVPEYFHGAIPWVKTGELRDGVIHDTEEHVSDQALRETSLKLLPTGTLLVAMYGQGQTRGRTGLLSRSATTNQACFAVLPNTAALDPRFLQYWFRHNYARLRQESESRGGNQPNLNGDLLKKQEIPVPPLMNQQAIVTTLDGRMLAAERAIKLMQTQLETIDKLPATLLRQAFNGEL